MNTQVHRGIFTCFRQDSNREMFCDFDVVVADVTFPCHRFVLNACSGFFEALLRCDMKERRTNKATLQGIPVEIFRLILDVLYYGSDVLTQGNMIEMWKAAHQLQMEFLVSACEEFVLKNIHFENWHVIYCNAKLLLSPKVIQFVVNYVVREFISVVHSKDFIKLHFEDLLNVIQSKQLTVDADFKIQAILKWCGEEQGDKTQKYVNKENNNNVINLGDLMQAVNFSSVSKKCLASLLTNKIIQENKEATKLVNLQASRFLLNPTADTGNNKQKADVPLMRIHYGVPNRHKDNCRDAIIFVVVVFIAIIFIMIKENFFLLPDNQNHFANRNYRY